MSRFFYRTLFAAALLVTVAYKIGVSTAHDYDLHAAVIGVLARHGATFREDPSTRGDIGRAMHFDVPGCAGVMLVIPVSLGLQERALFETIITKDYVRRFVYLNKVWLNEDRLGMRMEWLKHKAFSVVGLGRYVTIPKALVVAEPANCSAAETIDWSSVWDRSSRSSGDIKPVQ